MRQAQSKLRSAQSKLRSLARRAEANQRAALARLRVLDARYRSDLSSLERELRQMAARGNSSIVVSRLEWDTLPSETQTGLRRAADDEGMEIEFDD